MLLLAIVVGAALLYAPPIGQVTDRTVQYSLAREAGGSLTSGRDCQRRSEKILRCFVADDRDGADYELTRRGRRCWDAQKLQSPAASAALRNSVSGCATLRDQVRIF